MIDADLVARTLHSVSGSLVEKKAEQQSACSVHNVFDVGDVLQALEFEDQTEGYAGPQDPVVRTMLSRIIHIYIRRTH